MAERIPNCLTAPAERDYVFAPECGLNLSRKNAGFAHINGNMPSDGRWSFSWDLAREIGHSNELCRLDTDKVCGGTSRQAGGIISRAKENRLVKAEGRTDTPPDSWRRVEWTYDVKGRRIGRKTWHWTNSTWQVIEDLKFVSDPMSVGRHILELNASNNAVVRSYVWGLDLSGTLDGAGGVGGLLWVTVNSGAASGTHYCCYDGNGNVVGLVSATTGANTAWYEYAPFAEPIRISGSAARSNPFRFSTKRTDDTTDLVLYEYRAYSPTLGRWLSRDPLTDKFFFEMHGKRMTSREKRKLFVQSLSEAYLYNQALSAYDPLGLFEVSGCTEEVAKQISQSVSEICTKLFNTVKYGCRCDSYFKETNQKNLAQQLCTGDKNWKVTCATNKDQECKPYGTCASVRIHDSEFHVFFCPYAFEKETKCPSLGCLWLHEMLHWVLKEGAHAKIKPFEECVGCPPPPE